MIARPPPNLCSLTGWISHRNCVGRLMEYHRWYSIYIYIYRNQRRRDWRDVRERNEITMALFAHKLHTCGITRRTQPQLCTDTSHATKAAACTQATATIYNTQTRKRTIPSNENNAACSALELFKFPVPALHHQVCTRRLRDYCR